MPGAPIIPQSPTRKVGKTVYVSVPGPVPVIKAKRKHLTCGKSPSLTGGRRNPG